MTIYYINIIIDLLSDDTIKELYKKLKKYLLENIKSYKKLNNIYIKFNINNKRFIYAYEQLQNMKILGSGLTGGGNIYNEENLNNISISVPNVNINSKNYNIAKNNIYIPSKNYIHQSVRTKLLSSNTSNHRAGAGTDGSPSESLIGSVIESDASNIEGSDVEDGESSSLVSSSDNESNQENSEDSEPNSSDSEISLLSKLHGDVTDSETILQKTINNLIMEQEYKQTNIYNLNCLVLFLIGTYEYYPNNLKYGFLTILKSHIMKDTFKEYIKHILSDYILDTDYKYKTQEY